MNLSEIREKLEHDPDRELVIELLNNGLNVPPMIRAMAFMWVNQMNEVEFTRLSKTAAYAITYLENKDFSGLSSYLRRAGVPAPILEIIQSYAEHLHTV